MKTGLASGSSLLVVAGAIRHGTAPNSRPTAYDLWRLANRDAGAQGGDRRATRLVLFRHAMIHAGLVRTSRGTPYRRCAMCKEALE